MLTRLAPQAGRDGEALVSVDTAEGTFRLGGHPGPPIRAEVDGDTATYARVLPGGRDLSIQIRSDGFKQTVVVPSVEASGSYLAHIDMPAAIIPRQGEGGVEFTNAGGEVVATFGRGFSWDATFPDSASSFSLVAVELVSVVGTTASIEVAVDAEWLSAPERVFPVVIDPDFLASTGPGMDGPRDAFVYGAPEYQSYGFDHVFGGLWTGNYPRSPGSVDPTRTFMWFDLSSIPLRPTGTFVNYITPSLSFDKLVVYTDFENRGVVQGQDFHPRGAYDLYWVDPDDTKQFLTTLTADAAGSFSATFTFAGVGPPTPERSTGFLHIYVAGQGTAERWCVIALGKQVSTESRTREGQRIYRVWEPGSAADELGRSWTPEDPAPTDRMATGSSPATSG